MIANERIEIRGQVIIVLEDVKTGEKTILKSRNIVTDAGDLHYAQRLAQETPTNFGTPIMGFGIGGSAPAKGSDRSAITAVVAGSEKVLDGTYPQTDDSDADNTSSGTDILSYLTSYLTSEANGVAIDRVYITNSSPGGAEPLLMYATLGAFTKTSSQTMKAFINHTVSGV